MAHSGPSDPSLSLIRLSQFLLTAADSSGTLQCTTSTLTFPGRTLHEIYENIALKAEKRVNRAAHWLGFGPVAVSEQIEKHFKNGLEREAAISRLREAASQKLKKYCVKLMQYALPTEAPSTQLVSFRSLVSITSRYPGIRKLFLECKHVSCAQNTEDDISTWWDRPGEACSPEWHFYRKFAAAYITDTDASSLLEDIELHMLVSVSDGPGLSTVERLLVVADSNLESKYTSPIAVRYLGGILQLPSFWDQSGAIFESVIQKLCARAVLLLEDLAIDSPEPQEFTMDMPSDTEGVDILCESLLHGIQPWLSVGSFRKITKEVWYSSLRNMVQLLRQEKAEDILPRSWDIAMTASFLASIPSRYTTRVVEIPSDTSRWSAAIPAVGDIRLASDFTRRTGLTSGPSPVPAKTYPKHLTSDHQNWRAASNDIFAVIIGINYLADNQSPIRGAVNDARAFEKFLRDPREQRGHGVPAANIVLLEDEQATRDTILSTFQSHFLNNHSIPDYGEATMILFYAGAGGRGGAILPADCGTRDAYGTYKHEIPGHVLECLLTKLAARKGPNITVIFDACHSGGLRYPVRQAHNASWSSLATPQELDSHMLAGKTENVQAYRLWAPTATSYVLLAACHEDESAREIMYDEDGSFHGRFTSALLVRLRRLRLERTTYAELLGLVPKWAGQTPNCGGRRRNRLVFNGNYPATGRQALPLIKLTTWDPPEAVWGIRMGSVEGVVPGTEFEVCAPDSRFLCTFVAHSVEIDKAILVPNSKERSPIPWGSRVVVSDWKNPAMVLHVFTPPDFSYTTDVFPTQRPPGRLFVPAPSAAKADLVLRYDSKRAELVIEQYASTFHRTTRVSLLKLGGSLRLPFLIEGIAHFSYFLERHNGAEPLGGVTLEMHRLQGEYPSRTPNPAFGNLVKNGAVRIASALDATYGFTIRNKNEEDLFPYLFYFDPTWYEPVSAQPLRGRGGTVTIGMGSQPAFQFSLSAGEAESSGFLKLFIATHYLELAWIQQAVSPLDHRFEGTERGGGIGRYPDTGESRWDALNIQLMISTDNLK
ncbi:hypothetical protein GGX14DRAFT_606401 [Mycena pura]|uniref:Peptidase C14 caspase domain-containing protein n=1 Tax=Mycena pura TaxID=153505 RepID=A0AAD6XW69_9AGAR|nr:hypothetical protein GGX14DRAFT_606401 [Mycena pura]